LRVLAHLGYHRISILAK